MRRLPALAPIDIPTYDGLPSVGHPDVLDTGEQRFGGWRYWMAFTPYPTAPRENPSLLVSEDGTTWQPPDGLVNPVVTLEESQALGYEANSDPDLCLLHDGRLALYYRPIYGVHDDALFRKVSDDGVNWSEGEELAFSDTGFRHLSPSVLALESGGYAMWTVNAEGGYVVERRLSDDGLQWGEPMTCRPPSTGWMPWHIDVVAADGGFHALVASRRPWRLRYWRSTDGLTFTGQDRPLPLSGRTWDGDGHYRSAMVHRHGDVHDVWITGIDAREAGGDLWKGDWRIGHAASIDLGKLAASTPVAGAQED